MIPPGFNLPSEFGKSKEEMGKKEMGK